MNAEQILAAIDEILNDDDGTDPDGTLTLIACFTSLRIPASASLHD